MWSWNTSGFQKNKFWSWCKPRFLVFCTAWFFMGSGLGEHEQTLSPKFCHQDESLLQTVLRLMFAYTRLSWGSGEEESNCTKDWTLISTTKYVYLEMYKLKAWLGIFYSTFWTTLKLSWSLTKKQWLSKACCLFWWIFSFFLEQDAFFLHTETPSHFASVILSTSPVARKNNVKINTRVKKPLSFLTWNY